MFLGLSCMPDHQVTISTSRLQMERPNSSNYILIVCEHTEFFPFDGFFTAWIPELKSGEKKTRHFLRSVAHQISILALKLIKRGPNKMS